MGLTVAIIGLGQVGASLGLGLAGTQKDLLRIGHDIRIEANRRAEQMGAVDRIQTNLAAAVDKADLVILALPFDQVRQTLEEMAPHLRREAVLLDCSPLKAPVEGWMRDLMPQQVYAGILPTPAARYLLLPAPSPQADYLRGGLLGVAAGPGTPTRAVQAASDLAELLGAEHLLLDLEECDGLSYALNTLPKILSAALLNRTAKRPARLEEYTPEERLDPSFNKTINRPGWLDGRKLAGRAYAGVSAGVSEIEDPGTLAAVMVSGKEHTLRLLQAMSEQLAHYAKLVEKGETENLYKEFHAAQQARAEWLEARGASSWTSEELAPPSEIPSSNEWMGRLFGFTPKHKPRK